MSTKTIGVFEIYDDSFRRLISPTATLHRLHTGLTWAEGPAYFPALRTLVFSDVAENHLYRYDECNGQTSIFRSPSNHSNGNTVDRQGRLITCEQQTRRVTRTEHDGTITVLVDRAENKKRFNSPNDIVVKSDGSIWFTDPTYGIDSDYEGDRGDSETGGNFVYCLKDGVLHVVARDFEQPNGLAFSPDERRLYIVDTGRTHRPIDGPAHIRVFDVGEDGVSLTGGEVFAECLTGFYDGLRIDSTGNIWTSAGEGVSCYDGRTGTLLGRIRVPEIVANVCFGGGVKRNVLYICATTSLYSIRLAVNGCKTF
jgi:gluconolactonase